jgi:hypothetical protein
MVCISNLLAGIALAFTISAAPLTVPLGTSGQSLTISEDGGTITVGGQAINISQALSLSDVCSGKGKGGASKGRGGGNGKGSGTGSTTTPTNAKALYFITNSANNSIVALNVAADGTLSDGSITATGGAGMNGVDSTGAPAAPDALFSQGAVKVLGNVSPTPSSTMIAYINCNRAWSLSTPDQIQSRCLISTLLIQQNSLWWDSRLTLLENSQ